MEVANQQSGSINLSAMRLRLVLGTTICLAVFFPHIFQTFISSYWDFLRNTSIFQISTFETIWTVICYAVIEVNLTVIFLQHPEWRIKTKINDVTSNKNESLQRTKPRGMRRPSRRIMEGIIYVLPLLTMDLTMIKKFAGASIPAILETGNCHDTSALKINTVANDSRWTFLVPTFHNFTINSPLQTRRALPLSPPSSRRLTLELIFSIFIFDLLFFLFHLLLHYTPYLHSWHSPHHKHDTQLNPQVTNQLSVMERLGLVLLANFSLNVIGAHVLTRTLFVPLFVWLLIEIHSGLDLPWGYDKILPKGWGGGAKKHLRHHNSGKGDFEPFLCWCDVTLKWIEQFRV